MAEQEEQTMINNQELTIDEIQDAYENLSDEERAAVDNLVNNLIIAVKGRPLRLFGEHRKTQFGPKQALELLAKTGVWLIYHQPIGEAK
jgi:hypothetical protein